MWLTVGTVWKRLDSWNLNLAHVHDCDWRLFPELVQFPTYASRRDQRQENEQGMKEAHVLVVTSSVSEHNLRNC